MLENGGFAKPTRRGKKINVKRNGDRKSWTPPPVSDTWDDLDTTLDDDRLRKASELVLMEFEDVVRDFESHERRLLQKQLSECTAKACSSKFVYKLPKNVKAVPLILEERPVEDDKLSKVTIKTVHGHLKEVHVVPTITFKTSNMLPRMRYFMHTEKNVMTPDSLRLSHIPYVDEMVDDRAFVQELREAYTEGIHGADHGCGKYINDFMMYKLLLATTAKWPANDLDTLYAAIFMLFPNKYSLKELKRNILLNLQERFGGKENSVKLHEDFSGVHSIICDRDMLYDCAAHAIDNIYTTKSDAESIKVPVGEPSVSTQPCSENCYINDKSDNQPANKLTDLLETVFNTAISVNGWNCCLVARQMNTLCDRAGNPRMECAQWHRQYLKRKTFYMEALAKKPKQKKMNAREQYSRFKHHRKGLNNLVKMHPCNHVGSCDKANCGCYRSSGTVCTRHCRCGDGCVIRLPGCSCQPGLCHSNQCPCYLAGWECDPNRCLTCNSDCHDYTADMPICRNIGIQQGLRKKIRPVVSKIAGWGCIILEDAKRGDLISEYTGEVISQEEAERRGRIYDRLKLSYVFNVSETCAIDAARVGNTIRFANHDHKKPNCRARTIVIDGEQRIGVYAAQDLKSGDELFFDYGYTEDHTSRMLKAKSSKKN